MAHVVGVPKRDFCQKCELPVFLAERMVVGKKVFHRTCLKCARCRSQLTPGSFYETEVDDEYCCETCPDEEESSDEVLKRHDYSNGNDVRSSVRSSIADRLAFFEKSQSPDEHVELKNISDEEKSKSLKHLQESATVTQSTFKMSTAFNNFLNTEDDKTEQMEGIEIDEDEDSEHESTGTSITSAPSEVLQSDVSLAETPKPVSPTVTEQRFTTTAQLNLTVDHEQNNLEPNHEKPIPKVRLTNIPFSVSDKDSNEYSSTITATTHENDKINNNGLAKEESENVEVNLIEAEYEIDLVENNITKDNTNNQNLAQISMANTASVEINLQQEMKKLESEISTDLEVQVKEEEEEDVVEIRDISKEDVATTERLSVVRARLQQFEVNNNSNEKEAEIEPDNLSEKTLISPSTTTLTNDALETEKAAEEVPSLNATTEIEKSTEEIPSLNATTETEKAAEGDFSLSTTTEVPLEMEVDEVIKVPLITTTVPSDNQMTTSPIDLVKPESMQENIELEKISELEKTAEEEEELVEVRKTTDISSSTEYPEDLNPFKSDDDDEDDEENKENHVKKKKDELNPFDSSDDEVELEKIDRGSRPVSVGKVPPPRPPPPRISRNPFGEDEDFSRHSSLTSSMNKGVPVPKPRSTM